MGLHVSNDRTMRRGAQPVALGCDLAFKNWLRQQKRMLECWEVELISGESSDETLKLLQSHKRWLSSLL